MFITLSNILLINSVLISGASGEVQTKILKNISGKEVQISKNNLQLSVISDQALIKTYNIYP